MGRYPFLTMAKAYMEGRMLAETTKEREERNIRMLNRMVSDLKNKGKIRETNPAKFTQMEVRAIEEHMRAQGLGGSTIEKYRGILEGVCEYYGNAVYATMKKKGAQFSVRNQPDVRSLSAKELKMIQEAAENVKGWSGEVCRFLVAVLPCSGLRPSELRLAKVKDLNLDKMYIRVMNPKGKGKYGRERKTPILPMAAPAIKEFMKARKVHLEKYGLNEEVEWLLPSLREGRIKPYSSNSFRRFKGSIESHLPGDFEPFSLKTFRATYCQIILDDHPELLEDTAHSMGHSSPTTTQKFYRRIEQDKAVERIQSAFASATTEQAGAKKYLIEKKFEVTGYA